MDGRAVETYSSCEAFLETYIPSRKGCLIVDAQMQGMGGLALLEWLKSEKSELASIMITGYGDVSMAVRAMKAGAMDFIEKPIQSRRIAREHRERVGPNAGFRKTFRLARNRREMHRRPDAAGT